jgi:hypothetical protein
VPASSFAQKSNFIMSLAASIHAHASVVSPAALVVSTSYRQSKHRDPLFLSLMVHVNNALSGAERERTLNDAAQMAASIAFYYAATRYLGSPRAPFAYPVVRLLRVADYCKRAGAKSSPRMHLASSCPSTGIEPDSAAAPLCHEL